MLFSQTAEYALRAAVHLAGCHAEPQTNQQIATATLVPAGYLAKVLQALGRASLVRAQRGIGGGFTLSRAPQDITVLEIVNAVDPIERIVACPLALAEHAQELCPLHRKLDDAMGLVEGVLGAATLADVLKKGRRPPLCSIG